MWWLIILILCITDLPASAQSVGSSALTGTWTGRLSSRSFESFPVTLIINNTGTGKLRGAVNLISRCLKDATLEITMNGSNVVLAGSDPEGDTVTLNGTIDSAGTVLTLKYIVNGSMSAKCETDEGEGTLDKR
jgi:hypothetical protein